MCLHFQSACITSQQCDWDCEWGVESTHCLCVCSSVLSLSPCLTFHLCAVGCKWSRKWWRTLTNELLPDSSHVRLHHSWFGPTPTYAGRTVRGVGNRLGLRKGETRASIISPWPWDQGPEAVQRTVWAKRSPQRWAEAVPREEGGGSLSLSLSLSAWSHLITLFAHSVHVTASTHHLIAKEVWASAAGTHLALLSECHSLMSGNFKLTQMRERKKKNPLKI